MFEHKPFPGGQLTGHNSEETAYVVENYPYGFRARTTIRYWIETTKQGQRRCSQTMHPIRKTWNAPKKSTYSGISVMGLDEKGHVSWDGISMGRDESEAIAFEKAFALDDYQKKEMLLILGFARGMKKVTYTVSPGPSTQTPEEQRQILRRATCVGLAEIKSERAGGAAENP